MPLLLQKKSIAAILKNYKNEIFSQILELAFAKNACMAVKLKMTDRPPLHFMTFLRAPTYS